jgi:hypothetical protein
MHARLRRGPGEGRDYDVGDNPPQIGYLLVGGREFGPEVHRYRLSGANRDPKAPEPRATYDHVGRVPDN